MPQKQTYTLKGETRRKLSEEQGEELRVELARVFQSKLAEAMEEAAPDALDDSVAKWKQETA